MIAVNIQGDEDIQVDEYWLTGATYTNGLLKNSTFNHWTRHLTIGEQQRTNNTTN